MRSICNPRSSSERSAENESFDRLLHLLRSWKPGCFGGGQACQEAVGAFKGIGEMYGTRCCLSKTIWSTSSFLKRLHSQKFGAIGSLHHPVHRHKRIANTRVKSNQASKLSKQTKKTNCRKQNNKFKKRQDKEAAK